jgi:hypothetical protein
MLSTAMCKGPVWCVLLTRGRVPLAQLSVCAVFSVFGVLFGMRWVSLGWWRALCLVRLTWLQGGLRVL